MSLYQEICDNVGPVTAIYMHVCTHVCNISIVVDKQLVPLKLNKGNAYLSNVITLEKSYMGY